MGKGGSALVNVSQEFIGWKWKMFGLSWISIGKEIWRHCTVIWAPVSSGRGLSKRIEAPRKHFFLDSAI